MSTGLKLRPAVLAAKSFLAEGREKLQRQHASGSLGNQVCTRLTDLLDMVVLDLFEAALEDLGPEVAAKLRANVALVPNGGYGRRDVAPYSDVDLMILHAPEIAEQVALLARRLMHDLYDVGFAVGHSVRTPRDAWQMARKEATIFTSLAEARYLAGSANLYARFARKFQQQAQRHWRGLVSAMEKAREEERSQFGETVYLLEPNVKRSRGGLRDIQLVRWIGFARYGQVEPDALHLSGVLSTEDQRALRHAQEFLLRLRNELHFHAGKSTDVLDRAEQVRIAELFHFTGSAGLLPVEQFMREYFRHTDRVSHVMSRFAAAARPWRQLTEALTPLFSHQVEGDFRVGPARISATRRGLVKLQSDLAEVLRLADLANLYNKGISTRTWEAINAAASQYSDSLSALAAERFLSLLAQPARLGEILRGLHEASILERIVPEFAHARCLLQFNEYHKYTVDEHCIRAVERATAMLEDRGVLGNLYRGLKQKRILHLALLIHDLGKGYVEDHSELGLKIAENTAERLRLSPREAETLKFLVHKHLLMSHFAFRRDTSDDSLIVQLAVQAGSPDVLTMLFLLTAADLAAVGPGVLNNWKTEVLADLYHRAMQHLAGDSPSVNSALRRDAIRACLAPDEQAEGWFAAHIEALPSSYLYGAGADVIADDLRQLRKLQPGQVLSWTRYLPESSTVEYTVGTQESTAPGVFHRLTGALSSQGLQILSADINTLPGGLILDRFVVQDPDYAAAPDRGRLEEVKSRIAQSITSDSPPLFRKLWQSHQRQNQAALSPLPTVVRFDNSTSDRYTIIDIFTADRMGLLYAITRTLFEMELSVSLAKIGTYLDQVVDVFYVTDRDGRKLHDEQHLQRIRACLLESIQHMALA